MDFYPLFWYMKHLAHFLVGVVEPDSKHWAGRGGAPEAGSYFPLIMICSSAPAHLTLYGHGPLSLKTLASQ